ncbi:ATP-binding protein (plasmid) [Rhizobium sp. TH2]|uniref:ATP-binding protein n=1 Tax=Rhizobium sp. TH2 TaxID=2775403 RepID=UPI002157F5F0|nr:ATP-binding protein [Rhizobium sp. TH2]UVC12658.1 ATP-binding protein [Rhizobium sp. TH2]
MGSLTTFSVDTKLFRELGALLVGRESTALVELIKNAYDADATEVTILGENLKILAKGKIVVADNGIGMNEAEFSSGFLRIAGRSKADANRRSAWFHRRFTGEKGVGRLAAHKLAHNLKVISRRWDGLTRDPLIGFNASSKVVATIDWDAIEALEEISQIAGSGAVSAIHFAKTAGRAGTRLTLSPLRKAWSDSDLENFFDEVATLTPPRPLIEKLSATVVPAPILLQDLSHEQGSDGDFKINFAGELRLAESEVPASAEAADWVIEIDCDDVSNRLRISVGPTVGTLIKHPKASPYHYTAKLDAFTAPVGFRARILQRRGLWPARFQGVRVYYEGFRVLPYGDKRDDWLSLDQDYRSRKKEFNRLQDLSDLVLPKSKESEALRSQGNPSFFGAVLLTKASAPQLQMLVNREGFLPSAQFEFITDTVRLAIDLQVRVRVAATYLHPTPRNDKPDQQSRAAEESSSSQSPSAYTLEQTHASTIETLTGARAALARGDTQSALAQLNEAEKKVEEAASFSRETASEATMFRVAASIGLEQAAFVHEVRSIAIVAQSLATTLERLAVQSREPEASILLRRGAAEAREVRDRLRRNAIYLADMTGIEARRRRQRIRLAERVERVLSFYNSSIEKAGLTIQTNIPADLETPPLFPAEITAILSNLISNAIKFSGPNGIISISAELTPLVLRIRFENTGDKVDLSDANRWFAPFQSTTSVVDESLGQGMGLGLTITRSLLDEYGGRIHFVQPSGAFSTAIEVELPRK